MLVFSVTGTGMLKLPCMLRLRGKKALHVMFFLKVVQVGFCLLLWLIRKKTHEKITFSVAHKSGGHIECEWVSGNV